MTENFTPLGVCPEVLKSLSRMNISTATPVQSKVIGPFLGGGDLIVEAPTGTGKTCAFGIPIIQMINPAERRPQTLVLSPTRELALQISAVLGQLTKFLPGIRVATIYGGENIQRQFAALRQRPQIIVATPGRLVDHINRRSIDLSGIHTVVLDEADRMLDMGFRRDLNFILDAVPQKRQTALFSATLSGEIKDIARKYLHAPQSIRVGQGAVAVDSIRQYFTKVQSSGKNEELYSLLSDKEYPLALIFVRTKRRAASLALMLAKRGLRAGALHGNMSQPQRDRVMKDFRQGRINILVATDIAARGIDVQQIDAVINYDIPEDSDAYTHRIGRTGRADHRGIALTFVEGEQMHKICQIAQNKEIELLSREALAAVI